MSTYFPAHPRSIGDVLDRIATIRHDLDDVEDWLSIHWRADNPMPRVAGFQDVRRPWALELEVPCTSGPALVYAARHLAIADAELVRCDVRAGRGFYGVARTWGVVAIRAWAACDDVDHQALAELDALAPRRTVVAA